METHLLDFHYLEELLPASARLERECVDGVFPALLLHPAEQPQKLSGHRNGERFFFPALGSRKRHGRQHGVQVDARKRDSRFAQPAAGAKRNFKRNAQPFLLIREGRAAPVNFLRGEISFLWWLVLPEFQSGKRACHNQTAPDCLAKNHGQNFYLLNRGIPSGRFPGFLFAPDAPRQIVRYARISDLCDIQTIFLKEDLQPTPRTLIAHDRLRGEAAVFQKWVNPLPAHGDGGRIPVFLRLGGRPQLPGLGRVVRIVMLETGRGFFPCSVNFVAKIPERLSGHFEERGHKGIELGGQGGHERKIQHLFLSASENVMKHYKTTTKNEGSIPFTRSTLFKSLRIAIL